MKEAFEHIQVKWLKLEQIMDIGFQKKNEKEITSEKNALKEGHWQSRTVSACTFYIIYITINMIKH